jgi:predicted metal-dependent phosphoesterase TrpH
MRWLRANLHTHTINSDGDSPPEDVVAWYRDAGYDVLALTDHDILTDPAELAGLAGPMLLVRGEELTSGDVHVNGLGVPRPVPPVLEGDVRARLQGDIDGIRAVGGVPSVNHPNFRWQVRVDDLAELRDVRLFEIHNAGPEVNNRGGREGFPDMETVWDLLLAAGHRMVGVAVDDAHSFKRWGRAYSNPGRAWMMIRAEHPAEADVLAALEAGACYATTGVSLDHVTTSGTELVVDIVPQWELHYRTTFIGRDGRVLDVQEGLSARYLIRPGDGYVRARIEDSDGLAAWTQPLFEHA